MRTHMGLLNLLLLAIGTVASIADRRGQGLLSAVGELDAKETQDLKSKSLTGDTPAPQDTWVMFTDDAIFSAPGGALSAVSDYLAEV